VRVPRAARAGRAQEDRARAARVVRALLLQPRRAASRRIGCRPRDRLSGRHDRSLRHPRLDRTLRPAGPRALMARYTNDSAERVRDAVDFAELVGARTELKRAGMNRLQGLCPFHEERTPSFGIDPGEKLYYCFGCQAGGDVFKFVMETEGLDFTGALEWLAERYRVTLERESENPQEAASREARERLLGLLERTAAWYVRLLWESEEAAGAREYLLGRGLEEGALREYGVGWAPSPWDPLVIPSSRARFSPHQLLA